METSAPGSRNDREVCKMEQHLFGVCWLSDAVGTCTSLESHPTKGNADGSGSGPLETAHDSETKSLAQNGRPWIALRSNRFRSR